MPQHQVPCQTQLSQLERRFGTQLIFLYLAETVFATFTHQVSSMLLTSCSWLWTFSLRWGVTYNKESQSTTVPIQWYRGQHTVVGRRCHWWARVVIPWANSLQWVLCFWDSDKARLEPLNMWNMRHSTHIWKWWWKCKELHRTEERTSMLRYLCTQSKLCINAVTKCL